MAVQVLGQIHHAVVICICLIEFHQSELRIVSCIKAFISEYAADLIYFLETAYDQSLQVELQ